MANRRERFKKLYPKRLKNAVWNIQSIGKLSARTNYIYENKEVDEILLTLIFEIKGVMAKFGLGSTDMSSVFTTETEKKGPALKEETDELIKKLDEMHRSLGESTRSLQEAILLFTEREHEKSPQVVKKRNNYKDGKKDGYWESFHDNGKLSEKGNYKNGLRIGIWKSYHDNGQLWVRGKYTKEGTRDTSWEYFDKNGKRF
jgi:antitoxin component YwqK of YwqJK toxin-antitoxin module